MSASPSADVVAVADVRVVTARAVTAAVMPVRARREELQELSPRLCKSNSVRLFANNELTAFSRGGAGRGAPAA